MPENETHCQTTKDHPQTISILRIKYHLNSLYRNINDLAWRLEARGHEGWSKQTGCALPIVRLKRQIIVPTLFLLKLALQHFINVQGQWTDRIGARSHGIRHRPQGRQPLCIAEHPHIGPQELHAPGRHAQPCSHCSFNAYQGRRQIIQMPLQFCLP